MFYSLHSAIRPASAAAVVCCLVVGGVRIVSAAEEAKPSSAPPAIQDAPWFKQRDKNGDGKLAREEFWDPTLFAKIDADQDGLATPAELSAYYAKNPPQKKPAADPKSRPVTAQSTKAGSTNTESTKAAPTGAAATADDVEKRPVVIWSDGTRMAGDLYLPKNRKPDEKFPGIVLCAGTGGTKGGTQARVAPIFARNGFVVLAFDYRGWGESESQLMAVDPQPKPDAANEMTIKVKALRWQMNYTDQTEDIRAAVSFLAGEPNVDRDRIGLWGSSYGGGLVTTMAALDPRVKCVAAQVPGMGGRTPRAVAAALDLHAKQARGETEPVPIETGKMTGKMERYSNMRVNPAKSVGFSAVETAERITSPIIFVVAENEELSNNDNVEAVHQGLTARGVPSAYHVIKGITHYGVYRDGFEEATKVELDWFNRHLKGAAAAEAKTESAAAPARQAASEPNDAPRLTLEQGFQKMDADQNGKLTASEFETIKQGANYFRDHPEAVEPAFKRLDADGDGGLTLDEYRQIARKKGQAAPSSPNSDAPKAVKPADDKTSLNVAPRTPMRDTEDFAFFEKQIRPVLVAKCYECHSADAKEIKGGLALDTRAGLLTGGDSGPAVVPGNVRDSLLIAALRHEDGLEMPPKEKLSDGQIADFVRWVETGAPDPRVGTTPVAKKLDLEAGRTFWAFQPPRAVEPPAAQDNALAETDVDRFLADAQRRAGVQVVADAEPEALVRRLYFDLIGLPPSPAESTAFLSAWRSDAKQALAQKVDELLASPRFGERWGRHWLDVARYAESSGKETNFSYPQAWRFRDYVIESFNADVPFDRLIHEQIAGDLLPATDDAARARQIVATGFLAIGPKSHIERNKLQFELDLVDEQIDAVTQAFLGLTVACARCHDHKFDPIPQLDYYALAGIFRSTETCYGTIPVIQNNNPSQLLTLPQGAAAAPGLPAMNADERQRLEEQIAGLRSERAAMVKQKQFATSAFLRNGILLNTLEAKLKAYEADGSPKLLAMGVRDRQEPRNSPLYIRGEVEKPGDEVPRGFVQVLWRKPPTPDFDAGSGRLELAEWIASSENPLTARVYVNRVWSKLFGRGLVATPDNFGASGQAPTHPELLDYLAVEFMQDGWSTKRLIRRLVLSQAYRLGTDHDAKNFELDPDNTLLWRMSPRRLDAEAIRDAMLATAGVLQLDPPVGSVVARGGEGYTGGVERGGQLIEGRFNCRSVYLPALRGRIMESLTAFDGVDGSSLVGERSETTVPTQSLYLLNSPYVLKLAETAAARLATERSDADGRIDLAYQQWFGRAATDDERRAAHEFVAGYRSQAAQDGRNSDEAESAAWAAFCQSLWACGEFLARN